MNANIITSKVPRLSAISLALLSAFSFAGRTEAQSSTTPPQVTTEAGISPAQTKTSQDLGMNLQWQPDFAGIKYPITLPLGGYAFKLGLDYTYGDRTKKDVKFTSDSYVPYLEGQFGLGHNLQFDASIPWSIDTMTRKDSTGQDSMTRDGIGNLLLGLKQNVIGNDDSRIGFSYMIDGLVPTASNGRNNFFGGTTQSDNNNNDNNNTGQRDRNRSDDKYGLGVSGQISANLCCGLQATVNSGVMGIHSYCGCYYCFDNRISLAKTLGERFALQASYDTSVTTARDAKFVSGAQLGIIVKPTIMRGWEAYAGVKDQLTGERGDHFGGVLEFSYTH
jgi:hypothetical protein